MKLMVLNKVTEHSGKKIDTSKLDWQEWRKKINEESDELTVALHKEDKAEIMEECLDVIQTCIGIMTKLHKEGAAVEQGIFRHNKKLSDRGCDASAIIKLNVNKR